VNHPETPTGAEIGAAPPALDLPFTAPPTGPAPPLDVAGVPVPSVPGYEILAPLARGGLGIVYKGLHRSLGRPVAIKVIRPDLVSQVDIVRRFRREARAVARLTHPNIVTVYDADEYQGTPYIVMELLDGIDLNHLVEQRGRLPLSWACEFIRQAALGLQHAHERGLVHRDVKPSNLMITPMPPRPDPTGQQPVDAPSAYTVKVLDLGVARVVQPEEDKGSITILTQAGSIVGTPDFMAPEQVEHAEAVDIRADVYSLGATLYYLLAGQVPFPEVGLYQKLARLQILEPAPVETLRPHLPPALAEVVRRAMAKKPAERFATPAELAMALERIAAGRLAPSPAAPTPDATEVTDGPVSATTVPRMVAGSPNGTMDLVCRKMLGHTDWVMSVRFSPDGERLVSAGRDGTLRIWSPSDGREIRLLRIGGDGVRTVAFTPDGRHLVAGCRDGSVRVWTADGKKEFWQWEAHTGPVESLAVTPDGRRILTGGQDQSMRLWALDSGRLTRRIGGQVMERHWDAVLSVAILPDGTRAVSGSRDLTMRLWDLETGRELRAFRGARSAVACVVASPDGSSALSGGGNRLRLWPLSGGEARLFNGHEGTVLALAISPDGRFAASGSEDTTVRLWDVATGQQVHTFANGHQGAVQSVAFSPDGRRLASGATDRKVQVWQVPTVG
jgi:serine/threonine protein kinase